MRQERKKGLTYSSVMHGVIIFLMLVGLPSLFITRTEPEPMAITVDIVPIAPITNIKPSEEPPLPKPKEEEKKPEAVKPTPPTKTEQAQPTPPAPPEPKEKPEPKPVEKPKEPEPKPKPEEKKQTKTKPDDLLAVLKSVKAQAAKEADKTPDKKAQPATRNTTHSNVPYNPNMPISLSVKDSIRQQLYKCWSIDAGAKDAHELIVRVDLWLNRDGSLIDVQPTRETSGKMGSNVVYRAAAERALRAVRECSPLKDLPADKYEGWSYMQFTFDPSETLY